MPKAKFPKLLYVWEEGEGKEAYKMTADHPSDLPDNEIPVATYLLDKVRKLKIDKKLVD